MSAMTRLDVLLVLGEFDALGGGSLELVAWELLRAPQSIATAWEEVRAEGLIALVGPHEQTGELMYRLTMSGWAEVRRSGPATSGEAE